MKNAGYLSKQSQQAGAHTGFFNGRGTGLLAAMGPKVTLPKTEKLLGFGPLFLRGPLFLNFLFNFN